MSLKRGVPWRLVIMLMINFILNEINCQFNSKNLEKILEESQSDNSNLLLLDHQLLKGNCTLSILKKTLKKFIMLLCHPKLIYQHLQKSSSSLFSL